MANAGSDGEASRVYSLVLNAAASGLQESATNQNIVLVNNGGVIEGHVGSATGALAFTMSVNSGTGAVTLTQYIAVEHNDALDADEAGTSAAQLIAGSVSLKVEITDNDGDKASSTIDLGGGVTAFEDDGPAVTLTLASGAAIVVDETVGQNAGEANVGLGQVTVAGSSLFSITANAGSDGEASRVYSLVLNAAASGLQESATNQNIVLVNNGGVIEGHVGSATGALAFTMSVNSGTGAVTLTQYIAVEHNDALDADEAGASAAQLIAGSVSLKVEITDNDGDKASSTIDLGGGVTAFEDDGPTVSIDLNGTTTLTLDESIGVNVSDLNAHLDDNVAGNPFPVSYGTAIGLVSTVMVVTTGTAGADGADSAGKVVSLNVVGFSGTGIDSGLDALSGANILLFEEANGDVTGRTVAGGPVIFAIRIALDGTVTVAQYQAIKHTDATYDQGLSISGSALQAVVTMTDNDGDVATASQSIGGNIIFQDDGPVIAPQNVALANQVGNVVTASMNLDGGSDTGGTSTVTITGQTNSLGQALDASGNVLTSAGGTPLTYITVGDVLYATTNGLVSGAVFSVNPDAATGTYTITLLGSLGAPTQTFNSNFGTTDAGGPADPYTSLFTTASGQTQRVDIFGFGGTQANASSDGLGVDNNLVNGVEQVGVYFGTTVDKVIVTVGNFAGDQYGWKAIDLSNGTTAVIATLPDVDPATTTAWTLQEFYDSIVVSGSTVTGNLGSGVVTIGSVVDSGTVTAPGTLGQSDSYTLTLNPTASFDFFVLTANSGTGNNSFKIEQLSFVGDTVSSDVNVNFTATATDADGDTASSAMTVNFAGGTNGVFTVNGTAGDDVLNGSQGNDILTGGTGNDTFQWFANDVPSSGAPTTDKITDFLQSAGDKLNLSDLLTGESAGTLGSYLTFQQSGADVTLSIKAQGSGDVTVDQVIVLQGVTMAQLAGPNTADSTGVIANLLAANKLVTD